MKREGCGHHIFGVEHNIKRKMHEYVKKIYVHGCIKAMEYTLEYHVVPILTVFAISGSILAIIELLGVVLACCLANVIMEENRQRRIVEKAAAAGAGRSTRITGTNTRRETAANATTKRLALLTERIVVAVVNV